MKTITLAVIFIFLAGCSTIPPTADLSDDRPVRELSLTIEYVDTNNDPVAPEYHPDNVVLVFPHIPGEIFGSPSGDPILITPVSVGDRVVLDLAKAKQALAGELAPLKPGPNTEGLAITPADVQFTRVGTFPHHARTFENIGGGSFTDPVSRKSMILMYFDRPCTLTGAVAADGSVFHHAINIPQPGFHWIGFDKPRKNEYRLTRVAPVPGIVFSITLFHLQRI